MHNRLASLRSRHAQLEDFIQREQSRTYYDPLHVRSLKKIKLRVRDEIRRIERANPAAFAAS